MDSTTETLILLFRPYSPYRQLTYTAALTVAFFPPETFSPYLT